jgi:hypothetical protein
MHLYNVWLDDTFNYVIIAIIRAKKGKLTLTVMYLNCYLLARLDLANGQQACTFVINIKVCTWGKSLLISV